MDKKEKMKKVLATLLSAKYDLRDSKPKNIMEDADFSFRNGKKHYERHMELGELPRNMSLEQYFQKARNVSYKSINGRTVKAYRYGGNRTAKTDGEWFTSYVGGKGGTLITAFPLRRGVSRFHELMRRDDGEEIRKEIN